MTQRFGARYNMAVGAPGGPGVEVMRENHWEVQITVPQGADPGAHQGAPLDWVLSAQSVTMPKYKVEQVDWFHFNERNRLAAKPVVENIKVDFLDLLTPDIFHDLQSWYDLVYNANTGIIGFAKQYKRVMTIYLYDMDGAMMRTWFAYGVWPLNTPVADTMSYEDHKPVKFAMEFSCDWLQVNAQGTNAAPAPNPNL